MQSFLSLVLIATIVTAAGSPLNALSQTAEFQVAGELSFSSDYHAPKGKRNYEFGVFYRNGRWLLAITNTLDKSLFDYRVSAYDGHGLIRSLEVINSWVDQQKQAGADVGANTSRGRIAKGSIPSDGGIEMYCLWMAFCTRSYIPLHKGTEVLLPSPVNDVGGRRTLPVRIESSNGVPSRIDFVNDGKYLDQEGHLRERDVPFDAGYTNGTFRIVKRGIVHGDSIPEAFELITWGYRDSNLFEYERLAGRVVKSSASCDLATFIPELPKPGPALFIDERLLPMITGVDINHYLSDRWLSVTEAEAAVFAIDQSRTLERKLKYWR